MIGQSKKNIIEKFFRDEYQKWLWYVRNLIDDAGDRDAEDIIQDVILSIFDSEDDENTIDNISAYVYQSLRNKSIDIFRKRKDILSFDDEIKKGEPAPFLNLLKDTRYEASSEMEKSDLQEILYSSIDSLDPLQKAVVIATEFEGKSFKELSATWNIPIGTLLARKSRAMKKIKNLLKERKVWEI